MTGGELDPAAPVFRASGDVFPLVMTRKFGRAQKNSGFRPDCHALLYDFTLIGVFWG